MTRLLTAVNNPDLAREHKGVFGMFLRDSWELIGRILTVSRLKYKPDLLLYLPDSVPISAIGISGFSKDFGTICDERSMELLAFRNEKGLPWVNVLWSGGIDSTLALVSILKNWSPEERRSIRIVCSKHSVEEYPFFFYRYIRGRFPVIDTMSNPYDTFFDDAVVLTGEFGDQTFGSDITELVARHYGGVEELKTGHYRRQLIRYFTYRRNERKAARFLNLYEPIVEEAPFPIRSAADFLWWWNFTQKWQYVKFRGLLYSSEQHVRRNRDRIFHFFESLDFQRWSLTNHDKKMPGGWDTYKQPAKELIVAFTGDEDYRKKLKVRSLMNLNTTHPVATALTENWKFEDEIFVFANPEFRYDVR